MTTFSQAVLAIQEIASRINQNNNRMAQAQSMTSQAKGDLDSMTAQYGPICTDIDAMLVAAPGDVALENTKAQKDLLVAEFLAAQTRANTMNDAIKNL